MRLVKNKDGLLVARGTITVDDYLGQTDAAAVVRTVPFASNNGVVGENQSNGTDTGVTFRTYHVALVDTFDPFFAFGNYLVKGGAVGVGGDQLPPNAVTIAASLEYPINSGTLYPLTFNNGSKTVVIPKGGTVYTDVLPFEFTAGNEFQMRTYVEVASGEKWTHTVEVWGALTGKGEGKGTGDLTESGTITASNTYAFGPIGLFGKSNTTKPVVLLSGDSIMYGQSDDRLHGIIQGYASRALIAAGIPYQKIAKGGEFQSVFATMAGHRMRMPLARYCTHVLLNHATNDIRNTAGINLTTLQTQIRAIWKMFAQRGMKVYQCNATPQASSTDSFATVVNQTAQSPTLIAAFNGWLDSLSNEPNLSGVLDIWKTVANSGGKWNVRESAPTALTVDGVHPNGNGYILMSQPVTAWANTIIQEG